MLLTPSHSLENWPSLIYFLFDCNTSKHHSSFNIIRFCLLFAVFVWHWDLCTIIYSFFLFSPIAFPFFKLQCWASVHHDNTHLKMRPSRKKTPDINTAISSRTNIDHVTPCYYSYSIMATNLPNFYIIIRVNLSYSVDTKKEVTSQVNQLAKTNGILINFPLHN